MNPPRRFLVSALCLAIALCLLAAAGQQPTPSVKDENFSPLVKGTDPGQFQLVGFGPETIKISGEGEVALSGNPSGYFATKESYSNYVLRFEWKYNRPADLKDDASFDGNSGLLLHIREPHKVWPTCTEAQLMNRDAGHLFGINGAKFNSKRSDSQRQEAQKKAIKPVGQWNSEEVTCQGGTIRVTINGVLIDEGDGADPASGPIGWQSEGRPISFRNLRIAKL